MYQEGAFRVFLVLRFCMIDSRTVFIVDLELTNGLAMLPILNGLDRTILEVLFQHAMLKARDSSYFCA